MTTTKTIPTEIKVLMNHIYELNKGVRQMVLFTCNKKYGQLAVERLESQGIPYVLQPAGQQNLTSSHPKRILSLGRCSATTSAHNAKGIANVSRASANAMASVMASVSTVINHIIIFK